MSPRLLKCEKEFQNMHPPIQKITTSLPKINAASYFEHYGADYKDVIKLSPEVI
jgi:hypothetical protein